MREGNSVAVMSEELWLIFLRPLWMPGHGGQVSPPHLPCHCNVCLQAQCAYFLRHLAALTLILCSRLSSHEDHDPSGSFATSKFSRGKMADMASIVQGCSAVGLSLAHQEGLLE